MEIKWANVAALGLVILSVVLAVRNRDELQATLGMILQVGPGHTPEEQVLGLCVLGVLCVAGVVIVRLILEANRRKDQ